MSKNDQRVKAIERTIDKGLKFLEQEQSARGSFPSLSATDTAMTEGVEKKQAVFATALILLCLKDLPETLEKKEIVEKSLSFLLKEKSSAWSWNYWERGSPEARLAPIPDDLDDTFCALAAIHQYRLEFFEGKALASITKLLTETEEKVGGPYNTWLIDHKKNREWKDVDLVVNINIAYLLSLEGISLPSHLQLMEEAMGKKSFASKYYSPLSAIYFLSRTYKGPSRKKAIDLVLKKRNGKGHWANPLETTMAISSLLNFGFKSIKLERAIDYIIKEGKNGSWKPFAVYIESINAKNTHYGGSAALTTAFSLEALMKYKIAVKRSLIVSKKSESEKKPIILEEKIISAFSRKFIGMKFLQKDLPEMMEKMRKNDPGSQITLLPYFFSQSLQSSPKKLPKDLLVGLGIANLSGWIAYKIYDDFMDNEGDPRLLPLANFCLLQVGAIYKDLLSKKNYPLFEQMMNDMEEANLWERQNTYKGEEILNTSIALPNYGNYNVLADKSLPHCLGPVTILSHLGFGKDHPETKKLITFFRHYLIARQLNDDAHDWLSDLDHGLINTVGTKVLQELRKGKGKKIHQSPKLKNIEEELQSIFWNKVIKEIAKIIHARLALAKKSLPVLKTLQNKEYLESLLLPLEKATDKALKESETMKDFLKNY